jgi:REP element-mobilizing transposase RayT
MPPKPRDVRAGTFHIYTHCVWAVPHLYRDDVDRLEFLRHLARAVKRPGWTCLQYCLMNSHYHLMVDVEDGVLSRAMHAINLAYARHYNRRYNLRGHVQGWRYGSSRIVDDNHLIGRFAYIANNPVEAGLCATPAEWPWSSYAATIGLAELPSFVDPTRILRCFKRRDIDPRAALRARVENLISRRRGPAA